MSQEDEVARALIRELKEDISTIRVDIGEIKKDLHIYTVAITNKTAKASVIISISIGIIMVFARKLL